MLRPCLPLAFLLTLLALPARGEDFQGSAHPFLYDDPPIGYSAAQPDDPISRLQANLDAKEVKLRFDNEFGWLPALLDELKVPKSSQMLVFSKTSLQRRDDHAAKSARALFQRRRLSRLHPGRAGHGNLRGGSKARRHVLLASSKCRARKPKFIRESGLPPLPRSRRVRSACRGTSSVRIAHR